MSYAVGLASPVPGRLTQPHLPANAASKARNETTIKLCLAAALPSVQLSEHWFHPDRGAVFSLARIEVADLHDNLSRLREVSEEQLQAMLSRLEPVHAAMLPRAESPL